MAKPKVSPVSQANKNLLKLTKDLTNVAQNLETLAATSVELTDEIELQQSELDELKESKEIELRKANAELDLKVLENEDRVLGLLMGKRSLARVTELELETLTTELETVKSDNEDAVKKAVGTAINLLTTKHEGEMKALKAEHDVDTAEKVAEIKSQNMQIEFLEKQITTLIATATLEREAKVSIAEADSKKSGTVINNGK